MNRAQLNERRLTQFLLLLVDGLALIVCFSIALKLRFISLTGSDILSDLLDQGRFFVIYGLIVFSFYLFDLYEPRHWRTRIFSPLRVGLGSALGTLLAFAWFYFFTQQASGLFGRGVFIGAIFLFMFLSLFIRFGIEKRVVRRRVKQRWLYIGEQSIFDRLKIDLSKVNFGATLEFHSFTEPRENLAKLLMQNWTGVVVGTQAPTEMTQLLMRTRLAGQVLLSLQSFYEFQCGKIPIHSLNNAWFAFTDGFAILHSPMSVRLKRVSDIVLSTLLLILMSPVMLLVAICIRLESRGAALFCQTRVGIEGYTFTMWKFRSMCSDAEKDGAKWASKNDTRVTLVGRIIRKTRLDELPQLWNILKGNMSFVGPRPERPEFTQSLSAKIPFYDFRHLVKPGLTGWAQVMYPYGASEEDALEKLQYELFYIKNYSFELDLEIVFKTVAVVVFGAGR